MELGIITVMERSDSKQFKEKGLLCTECSFCSGERCTAYGGFTDNTSGDCDSATKYDVGEKAGSVYVDVISQEY